MPQRLNNGKSIDMSRCVGQQTYQMIYPFRMTDYRCGDDPGNIVLFISISLASARTHEIGKLIDRIVALSYYQRATILV